MPDCRWLLSPKCLNRRTFSFFMFAVVVYLFFFNFQIRIDLITIKRLRLQNFNLGQFLDSNHPACSPIRKDTRLEISLESQVYPKVVPVYNNESIDFDCLNDPSREAKIIYLWTGFWSHVDFRFGLGRQEPFKKYKCPAWNCEVTNDRRKLDKSHAVIVHAFDVGNVPKNVKKFRDRVPKQRPPFQRWIYVDFESPVQNEVDHIKHIGDDVFNMSATYMPQSDFNSVYFGDMKFRWSNESSGYYDQADVSSNKVGFAAAMISHCKTAGKREAYIKKLATKISVDVFGECGQKCPKVEDKSIRTKIRFSLLKQNSSASDLFKHNISNASDESNDRIVANDCRRLVALNYKFFLAFENSFCQDYVTEKFFRTINYDVVPIVMGNTDYSRFIPKSGYIDARDYKEPEELADYLIYLDKNKTAYNEYFKWKNYIRRNQYLGEKSFFHTKYISIENFMCELCTKLLLETHFGIEVKKLRLSELISEQSQCQTKESALTKATLPGRSLREEPDTLFIKSF